MDASLRQKQIAVVMKQNFDEGAEGCRISRKSTEKPIWPPIRGLATYLPPSKTEIKYATDFSTFRKGLPP
jgi:hypothetical protein